MRKTPTCFWLVPLVWATVHAATALAYVPEDRWTVTASGTTGGDGTPITLTWSIAPDGTNIPGEGPSNLVSYFDGLFDVGTATGDLTTRPWFALFEQAFDRWSELGGITFVYEPNDNGTSLQTSGGVLGMRGDVRLGGAFVDGPGGTLAYAWLPNSGDIVLDTGETAYFSNSANNYRQLRNTLMHEIGHAFGLLHVESSTEALLMEPIINTSIDGPQLDDIRGIQGLYGDVFEKSNNGLGNGAFERATSLGMLAIGGSLAVGSDAVGGQSVGALERDFVSIANSADVDFYSFTLSTPARLDVTLTPLGGVFNQAVEGGQESSFDANARNDLELAVLGTNGTTLLGTSNLTGAGGTELITDLSLDGAGTYYLRVTGVSPNVQLYQLVLSASPLRLPGDYNQDGVVDAGDYVVWRNMLGTLGTNLPADGNGNGRIDVGDYAVWKENYGMGQGSGGLATNVPEPGTTAVFFAVLSLMLPARRSR